MSRVFIEFSVGEEQHRIDIQLFDHRCPKAIANFLYLLCAHEVPDHVISAREAHIGGPLPAPLKATRVSRIDVARQQIDFGVSGTASVFAGGGCYDDEILGPTHREQQDLQAKNPSKKLAQIVHPNFLHDFGTVSVANCGPNTNGSKYFISLGRRADIDGFHQIIGSVAAHSQQALRELANCKVNIKKGCVPEPAIKVSDCGIVRAVNENGWKELALGTSDGNDDKNNSNNSSNNTQQPQSRLKMLKGRGSQLEKRSAQGDGEDLLNFEQSRSNDNNSNNNNNNFTDLQASLDAGELARRRAKKRRIEDAAAGSGAWVEPPEVVAANQGSANRSGVVNSSTNNNNNNNNNTFNNNNNNNNKMSISQAYQFSGGNLDRATQMVNQNDDQQQLSERSVFAVAARANQFMQDIDSISAAQKAKAQRKNSNNNTKKRTLRY